MATNKAAAKKTAAPEYPSPRGEYLWVSDGGEVSDENFPTADGALANYEDTGLQDDVAICSVVARYEYGFVKKQ